MRTVWLVMGFALAAGLSQAQDLVYDFAKNFQEEGARPIQVNTMAMGSVADVGHGRVLADQVFELWTPIWSETQAKVRNDKMSPHEGDMKLQEEWERAVRTLIKEELFFQEADREHNSTINNVVGMYMKGGADRPRSQIAAEVRRNYDGQMNKFFNQLNQEVVKESGGMIKLNKVLASRGLTFNEWQNRLRRKAFTQTYLHQILSPRAPKPGPKHIQEYYAGHPEEFSKPGIVRFRHIFLSNAKRGEDQAREDAVEAWERLVDAEIDFVTAVHEYSDDEESRERDGLETEAEASNLEREAWLNDIRTSLREENPNEIGAILESPFGCHVAMLLGVGPRQKIPFSEVRREIEDKLQSKVWEEETDRYFEMVRKSTPIRVNMPSFPRQMSCAALASISRKRPRVVNTSRPEVLAPRGMQ